jgi:hypothetical protein
VGPPASLTIVSGDQQQAIVGTELANPLVVKVLDANGNPVQGQTINFRVTAGGGSVFAGASSTNADGIAQERWTLGTVAGADQTVEARAVDNSTGQALVFATFHATGVPDAASALKVAGQPAATAQSGVPLSPQPTVQVTDKYGNGVHRSGVQVTATIAANGQTLAGTATAVTDEVGVAAFSDLVINGSTGSVALTFSATGLTAATSNSIVLGAGPAAKLAIVTQPSSTAASGQVLATQPSVRLTDSFGNAVAVSGVQVTASNNGGATLSGSSATTDASGLATFSGLTITGAAGAVSLTFTAPNLTSVTSSPIALGSGAASQLKAVGPITFIGTVGSALATPPKVVVQDAGGNPVAGVYVQFVASTASGSVAPATVVSDINGNAALTSWTLGTTAGIQTITASAPTIASAKVVFTATAQPGAASQLVAVAGNGDSVATGQTLTLIVRATDSYGNPVPGATVNWEVIGSTGGTLSAAASVTDQAGQANVVLTAPPTPKPLAVNASLQGGGVAGFSITVVPLTRRWIGGAPGAERDWSNSTNWNPIGVPALTDVVVIPVTTYKPRLVADVLATSVTVAPGTELQLNGYRLQFSCCTPGTFSGTFSGTGGTASEGVFLDIQSTLTGATTVPNLATNWGDVLNVNGQALTVRGNLTINPNGALVGGGTILVYGSATLNGNQTLGTMGLLEAKGDISIGCYGYPCFTVTGGTPLVLSGTSHQNVSVVDPTYVSWGSATAQPGTDVTITAQPTYKGIPLRFFGDLDLYGNLMIPAGSAIIVSGTVRLHSGSTTTVLGKLTFGSCTAEPGATYTGFTCP